MDRDDKATWVTAGAVRTNYLKGSGKPCFTWFTRRTGHVRSRPVQAKGKRGVEYRVEGEDGLLALLERFRNRERVPELTTRKATVSKSRPKARRMSKKETVDMLRYMVDTQDLSENHRADLLDAMRSLNPYASPKGPFTEDERRQHRQWLKEDVAAETVPGLAIGPDGEILNALKESGQPQRHTSS